MSDEQMKEQEWEDSVTQTEPMYMPGRFRTASSPSSTWISEPPYSCSV